jgi:nucleotide-binding universal stress UspA family protein
MMHTILFPTDGSSLSERAFPLALQVARAQNARLLIAQVVPYLGWLDIGPEAYLAAPAYQEVVNAMDADAQRNTEKLVVRAQLEGVPAETAVLHGSPAAELVEYEEQRRPDLVVMASHGRTGLTRFALGSVADTILREATAPVLLARSFGQEHTALARVLVPLDGSALAEKALDTIQTLAGKPITQVQLYRGIVERGEWPDAIAYLDKIALQLRDTQIEINSVVSIGEPFEMIAKAARSVDLVVMATHGRGGLDRVRHGSVADRVLRELPVPVLLVRSRTPEVRQPLIAAASLVGAVE